MKHENFTGVILAGGQSSRMGQDKGFLKFNNEYYTQILIDIFSSFFQNVIIIANDTKYHQFNIPVYNDIEKNKGPLGGIYTGLLNSDTDFNFFVPCDSPFLSMKLIKTMIKNIEPKYEAIIPQKKDIIYPLTAIYNKSCLNYFQRALEQNKLKVKSHIKNLNHKKIHFNDEFEKDFLNLNTPEEVSKLKI